MSHTGIFAWGADVLVSLSGVQPLDCLLACLEVNRSETTLNQIQVVIIIHFVMKARCCGLYLLSFIKQVKEFGTHWVMRHHCNGLKLGSYHIRFSFQ